MSRAKSQKKTKSKFIRFDVRIYSLFYYISGDDGGTGQGVYVE